MSYVKTPLSVGGKKPLPQSSVGDNISSSGTVGAPMNGKAPSDTGTNGHASDAPKLPPKPVREQVRVIFSYTAQNEDELTIKENDIITVISKENEDVGWWKGELNGRIALFPDNFIEPYHPQTPPQIGVRSITAEMNNSQQNANDKPATIGLKKPERPSSLAKTNSNNDTDSQPPPTTTVTPTSPSSHSTFAPNSVASKMLKFSQLGKQNSQPTGPAKPPVSLTNSLEKQQTNKHDSDDSNKKTPKSPAFDDNTSSNEPGRLTHLTTLRPKIPTTARRPPSMPPRTSSIIDDPSSPTEPSNGSLDSGNESGRGTTKSSTKEPSENGTISATPIEKKPVPWLNDLKHAQKKRINVNDNSIRTMPQSPPSSQPAVPTTTANGPTAITAQNVTSPSSSTPATILSDNKPITTNKPSIPSNSTKPAAQASTGGDDDHTNSNNTTTNKSSNASANIINSATTTNNTSNYSAKDAEAITELKNDNANLRNEIRDIKSKFDKLQADYSHLNSTLMSQEDLLKQKSFLERLIREQNEAFASQKTVYFEMVKELINENSENKKKVANLELELDRIRKLNITLYN